MKALTSSFLTTSFCVVNPRSRPSFVFLLAFTLLLSTLLSVSADSGPIVQTPLGPIEGELNTTLNVKQFTNIPFALPPVGARRWAAPVPITTPWSSPYQAVKSAFAGSQIGLCLQVVNTEIGSEDCLYLNVTVPNNPTISGPLPVVIYIYGGGFQQTDIEDLSKLVSRTQSVIYVQIAYRLGVWGFFTHPGLSVERVPRLASGNYGLFDQQLAMQWVMNNIASFGGDVNSITLHGFSAGAISICSHLVAPGSRGLFHRAIIESGGCDVPNLTLEQGEAVGVALANKVPGCATNDAVAQIACLRNTPTLELDTLASVGAGAGDLGFFGVGIHPVIDGVFWVESAQSAFNRGAFMNVPVLAGTSRLEMLVFMLEPYLYASALWGTFNGTTYSNTIANMAALVASYSSPALNSTAVEFFTALAPGLNVGLQQSTGLMAYILSSYWFQCPQRRMMQALAGIGNQKNLWMYTWEFNAQSCAVPFPSGVHGSQTAYVYDTPGNSPLCPSFENGDQAYANQIQTLWMRFILTNNPNTPYPITDTRLQGNMTNVPVWPPYQTLTQNVTGGDSYFGINGPLAAHPFSLYSRTSAHEYECGIWDQAYVPAVVTPRYQACPAGLTMDETKTSCVTPFTENGGKTAVVRSGYAVAIAISVAIVALML